MPTASDETAADQVTAEAEPTPDWVADAIDHVPDEIEADAIPKPVLDNKIVRVKYPQFVEDDVVADEGFDEVTDEDRQRVRDALAEKTADTADTTEDVSTEMDRLTDESTPARLAATDGGQTLDSDGETTESSGRRMLVGVHTGATPG